MEANRFKELRIAQKISQKELAERIGVSQQTVASWEVGRTEPSNGFLKLISSIFNVSTDYLLGNDNPNFFPVFNDEEIKLVTGYRTLDNPKRQTLFSMLDFLKSPQSTIGDVHIQSNTGNGIFFANNGNVNM